jgi:hypothetical protein
MPLPLILRQKRILIFSEEVSDNTSELLGYSSTVLCQNEYLAYEGAFARFEVFTAVKIQVEVIWVLTTLRHNPEGLDLMLRRYGGRGVIPKPRVAQVTCESLVHKLSPPFAAILLESR